jgi:hypothetical protein
MEIIEDFVRASASIDIPLALSQCEKAELQRLLPSVRLAGEWLIDLLGDASDRLVGCGSERISGGEPIVGQRDVEDVFDGIEPERASKPNALNEALITAPQPEREELPTLDPRAWSMSTAQQREVFVKAVGRSAIEDAFNSIESGYTLTRGLNTLNQAWCAATESDRRTFYRQLFPANIFNRFQA